MAGFRAVITCHMSVRKPGVLPVVCVMEECSARVRKNSLDGSVGQILSFYCSWSGQGQAKLKLGFLSQIPAELWVKKVPMFLTTEFEEAEECNLLL